MFFSRKINSIKRNGPPFLKSLDFDVLGIDCWEWTFRGGLVSFFVRENANPSRLYNVWVHYRAGELQMLDIRLVSPNIEK